MTDLIQSSIARVALPPPVAFREAVASAVGALAAAHEEKAKEGAQGGPQRVGKERTCFSHRYVGTSEEQARRDEARKAGALPVLPGSAVVSDKKRQGGAGRPPEADGSKQRKIDACFRAEPTGFDPAAAPDRDA